MQTTILEASVEFIPRKFAAPLIISSGAINDLTEAIATVRVRANGREASGRGSIYMSDLWAWPDLALTHEHREREMIAMTTWIAENLRSLVGGETAHPTELGLRLHHSVLENREARWKDIPALARGVCMSLFDAAIHDATGHAVGRSAFCFYDDPASCHLPSAEAVIDSGSPATAIKQTLLPQPKHELPAWVIVGKNDDLERDLRPWVDRRGFRCFKLKIMGKDNSADVARTVDVFRAIKRWGVRDPWMSIDSNEGNPDAASVGDYLDRLRAADASAYEALRYIEQPTARDIRAHPQDWSDVSRSKPVLLDEGLTDFSLLADARDQHWTGLALKTCKGHSFTLVAAAWAKQAGMTISLQDLTNPGLSMIHEALVAAHLPTINGVEMNSPQFCPGANQEWLPRLAGLFDPHEGVHRLPEKMPVGLGSSL